MPHWHTPRVVCWYNTTPTGLCDVTSNNTHTHAVCYATLPHTHTGCVMPHCHTHRVVCWHTTTHTGCVCVVTPHHTHTHWGV
jgi:hypothetical protein